MTPEPRPTPTVGSCSGFAVRSHVPFETLRSGGGALLHVAEGGLEEPTGKVLVTWPVRPDNPFHGRLLRDGDRYAFWASDAGWFVIDPQAPSITVSAGGDALRREMRLFGVPTAICVLERGDVSIHAAAVDVGGHGVLLAGPSRFGKTTLAAAFARAGHRLLAEDTAVCTSRLGPAVFPGPAAVRLRADVASSLDLPGRRAHADDDGRVRIVLDEGVRGSGDPVPLRAILFLRHGTDAPALAPADPATAIRDVLALTLRLPTDVSQAACFERVTDLVTGVECLDLQRRLTMDELPLVIGMVERAVGA